MTKVIISQCSQSGEVEFFFEVHGRAWAFTGLLTVPPRRTSDCDFLQMTRDAFGASLFRIRNCRNGAV